jgi:hypothetical protein
MGYGDGGNTPIIVASFCTVTVLLFWTELEEEDSAALIAASESQEGTPDSAVSICWFESLSWHKGQHQARLESKDAVCGTQQR